MGNEGSSAFSYLHSEEVIFSMKEEEINRKDLPIVKIPMNGKTCTVLIDSGSTVNVIDKITLTRYLDIAGSQIQGQSRVIKGIAGKQIKSLGNVNLEIDILSHKFIESFLVLEDRFFSRTSIVFI